MGTIHVSGLNGSVHAFAWDTFEPAQATPLMEMMNFTIGPPETAASYAPVFQNGEGPSYLIIIADGKDTCGLEGICNPVRTPAVSSGVASITDLEQKSANS